MAEERETRAGAFSGLLALIMVVALSVMAFSALQPARDPPLRMAGLDLSLPDLPAPTDVLPEGRR
jgi:hypothetical protein